MVRCISITCFGKRCKKTGTPLCQTHVLKKCGVCTELVSMSKRIILKGCGHVFCKNCLAEEVYDFQWFPGFSTINVIKCPDCDLNLCDDDWKMVTSNLCDHGVLQRQIIRSVHLCPYDYVRLGYKLDVDYPIYQVRNHFDYAYSVDIVYFETPHGHLGDHIYYSFCYGQSKLLLDDFRKELAEYVFHPSRIKNIEDLDDM